MGNSDLNTTMIYLHGDNRGPMGSISQDVYLISRYTLISGPITTVSDGHKLTKSTAVTTVCLCCMEVVLGKQQKHYFGSRKPPKYCSKDREPAWLA